MNARESRLEEVRKKMNELSDQIVRNSHKHNKTKDQQLLVENAQLYEEWEKLAADERELAGWDR